MEEDKKKEGTCGCGCSCRVSKLLIALLLLLAGMLGGYFIGRCSASSCHTTGMGQAMCSHMQQGGPEASDKP